MATEGDSQTDLAVERTQLAWWRTGLTALAVGVGIGRIVPDLGHSATHWPYGARGARSPWWGHGIDSTHHIAENAPAALVQSLREFL